MNVMAYDKFEGNISVNDENITFLDEGDIFVDDEYVRV